MIHLHLHSEYSLRDSIIKIDDLIERLKEIGQDTVAITDHGKCLGNVPIYKKLKAAGMKYVHGVEFYICDDTSVKDKNSKYYHLVALCKNEIGRQNLNILISKSEHPDRKYYKPRIDFNLLAEYSEGLIIMSACLAGEISKAIMNDDIETAENIALKYRDLFHDDYYLEIQSHRDSDQIFVNKEIIKMARRLGIKCVVTCDAHYIYEDDKKYQNKYAFNGAYKEDGESYIDCFVQSEDEVRDRLRYLDEETVSELIGNTHIIADKCNVELPLSPPIMPEVNTPPEFSNNREWLETLCEEGFKNKLNIDYKNRCVYDITKFLSRNVYDESGQFKGEESYQLNQRQIDEYISRYEYEIDSLSRMGFIDYILLVYSYVDIGDRRGPGRGSGGGSLINFLAGITDIDPIEHKLFFERFIDVGSIEKLEAGEITAKELKIPDIDVDFSSASCDEVMRFLYNTYGEDKVASIGKFGTNKTKGTIRDMCKVFDIDLETADKIAKSFEVFEIDEIDSMMKGEIETLDSAREAVKYVEKYKELFEYVRKLNNLPKSFGIHACGRVISTRELDYYLPSSYDANGIRFLQGDMHDVEDVGLVKIDLLALRTLDQEYDTLEMSGEDVDFLDTKQDYKDPKVLDVFKKGDTCGVFQFSSQGMRQTLKKMDISGIDDISAANALFRPGAIAHIDEYCARKNGQKKITYLHPDLEPILKNTYGIIVFQEQLIEIGRMAGLRNPDEIRKGTAKKKADVLAKVKPELEEKLKLRGWSQEQFDQLWTNMLEFGRYSFNKCVAGYTKLYGQRLTVKQIYEVMQARDWMVWNTVSMKDDFTLFKNRILSITYSGEREVYRIQLKNKATIDCTLNHKFPTPKGITLAEDLKEGDKLYALSTGKVRPITISSIKYVGIQETYDIEMKDIHNFLTDSGIVTCNSHSSAYGIIAYMTAKQKVYYPSEFYAGLCNSYLGHSDYVKNNAHEIATDMELHNVSIAAFDYRQDHRKCSVNRNKEIVYGIPLIATMNLAAAEILYKYKDYEGQYLWQLFQTLIEEKIGTAKLTILIRLGFFGKYGNQRVALNILDAMTTLKFFKQKSIKKDSIACNDVLDQTVLKYSETKNKNGSESASYKNINYEAVMNEYEDCLKTLDLPDIPIRTQLDFQSKYLGFISLKTNRTEDRPLLYVRKIFPVRTKKQNKLFAYNVSAKSIGSGKSNIYTIYAHLMIKDPIVEGDIIRCVKWSKHRQYYVIEKYQLVN